MKVVIMRGIGCGPEDEGYTWDPSLKKEFDLQIIPRKGDDIDFGEREDLQCTYAPQFNRVLRVEWDLKQNRVVIEMESEQDSLDEEEQSKFIEELQRLGWKKPY